ncbi:MAG: sigma-70 family RNA polymerase sigma factor [Caulobacter sp.]|nr:sigma-70 family RNA polymerase sigma factor [Caulobacter sp.]
MAFPPCSNLETSPAQAGRDEPAPDLAAWMTCYGDRLRRYFARRAPTADVDDLVQDVFLNLQSARPLQPIVDVERYLFTVAHHALVNLRRHRTVRRSALHDPLDNAPEQASDLSPERILAGRQEIIRLVKAVEALPPRARDAFRLRRFDDLTYAVIAERMGISRDSVKELLQRATSRVTYALRMEG